MICRLYDETQKEKGDNEMFRNSPTRTVLLALVALCGSLATSLSASSHMDAPLITLDDAANTTDVYAFVSERDGGKYLTTALAVYPFEEPGIGPNKYNFDDAVRYRIHVSTGADLEKGLPTFTYEFQFATQFRNQKTILQSYLGPVEQVGDEGQNLIQRYQVVRQERRNGRRTVLGSGIVPPNNQGLLTRYYNQGNNGEMPAKGGVADESQLDRYTGASIAVLDNGHRAFAGQRDDGFYADIQSIFDLDFSFGGPNKPFDSQGGYNVHTIVLEIPVEEIGDDQQVVGVYASTARRQVRILGSESDRNRGRFVQVARQGNPLFNEALVAIEDKDLYSRSSPARDRTLFAKYALAPELAAVLGGPATNRTDIAAIFIPDFIKVDLSTDAARLAGSPNDPLNPDDVGFHRLSIFGGDVLTSNVQEGFGGGVVPGGWPNGRRFGDDVVDITVIAVLSDLRPETFTIFAAPNTADLDIDGVTANDISFNKGSTVCRDSAERTESRPSLSGSVLDEPMIRPDASSVAGMSGSR